ncbi:hypothetical protein [Flavobacterium azizsancarii]|nr:hypothetical protein [Flavobacterium azizsancarii]
MNNNIIGFHHFAIKAQDFEKTVQFYETLNFEGCMVGVYRNLI